MRLSCFELQTIRDTLQEVDPYGRIYLFGSRSVDTEKGGDIDVFFEASRVLDLKTRLALEYRIASRCQTKVDLLVKNPKQVDKAIYTIARKGISL